LKLEGHELPQDLPKHLVPPSKQDLAANDAQIYPALDE
jgi:hypothetical protein